MKPFGHMALIKWRIRGKSGETLKEIPARRITVGALGHNHGTDRGRKLIVSLAAGDLITFKPVGTRRTVSITAFDAYEHILRSQAMAAVREKQRAKKEAKQARLARRRQSRAEAKLFAPNGQIDRR